MAHGRRHPRARRRAAAAHAGDGAHGAARRTRGRLHGARDRRRTRGGFRRRAAGPARAAHRDGRRRGACRDQRAVGRLAMSKLREVLARTCARHRRDDARTWLAAAALTLLAAGCATPPPPGADADAGVRYTYVVLGEEGRAVARAITTAN